jgi:histidinol phosphatase-like PHP family hydrolase
MKHIADMQEMMEGLLKTGCNFIVSSDAHEKNDVANLMRLMN